MKTEILRDLKPYLTNNQGSAIVYVLTRKQADEITEILNRANVRCDTYHAGLSLSKRKQVHEDFARDKIQVIVATIAFGEEFQFAFKI